MGGVHVSLGSADTYPYGVAGYDPRDVDEVGS